MSENKTEDMWTPYKELYRQIEFNLTRDIQIPSTDLEFILRKHKQTFMNLLKNSAKNPKLREEIRKGMTEGITVRGIGHQILSKDLFDETVIISDMYDLNEYMALDLLCTAQMQLSYHPGLTRGLVAVLLYYDGRKAIVQTLRLLVQARAGILWRLGISDSISKYVTEYTDQLMNMGVFERILELLQTLDITKEVEILQRNRALGNPHHHKQVLDLYEEIRQNLAEIIYMYSAQSGLPQVHALNLINHLKGVKLDSDPSGGIDNVTLTLQMSLLFGLDLSVLHVREDGEEIVQKLPLLSESNLIEVLLNEISPAKGKWESDGLHGMALFAAALCLANLRLIPQSQSAAIEQEEYFIDAAIDFKVFEFINNVFLKNDLIYTERFFYYRMHNMLTDFIVLMQSKVKDLRIRTDDTARTLEAYAHEGLEAPQNLPKHFEYFLLCIAKLYSKDPLNLGLMLDYWCPTEMNPPQTHTHHRTPPRNVSLFKFVRLAGDMIPPSLFIPYLNMLASLSRHPQSARYCFNMLKQNGTTNTNNTISWDHFFVSLSRYLNNMHQETPLVSDTIYRHRKYPRGITLQEINGLHAVLGIIETVADYDDFSRAAFCEHPAWAPLNVFLGLITCSIPIPLKASLLKTLAALSKSPETAAQMWNNLEVSQVLVTIPNTSSYQPRGIQTELEEIESRNEEYPMTRALLHLLDVLTDSGIPRTLGAGPRKPGFDPYLTFIINSVFLKFHARAYKNADEKWLVAKQCMQLLEKLLDQYEPSLSDFPTTGTTNLHEFNRPPGFHIMIQLNTKSSFLDLILFIIDEGCTLLDTYSSFPGKQNLLDVTLSCLNMLNRCLILQSKFSSISTQSQCNVLLTNLTKLLLVINPRSGKPDYILRVMKYIGYQTISPRHALAATNLLINITKQPAIHTQVMTILLSYSELEIGLRHGFVLCLDADEDWRETQEKGDIDVVTLTKEGIIKLMKQCINQVAPNFAHYLLGFDLDRDVSKTIFHFPGVLGKPRTCLHALFSVMHSIVITRREYIKPTLIESAYGLLYSLCSCANTSLPVLRFIRQNQEFYSQHIESVCASAEMTTSELNQLSYLLKIIAIEQKISAASKQIFHLKSLTKLLVGFPAIVEKKDAETIDSFETPASGIIRVNRLKELIKNFDFTLETLGSQQWDFFDTKALSNLFNNCEIGQNPRLIDIRKLHHTLIDELSVLQGTSAATQRQFIMMEIQNVLTYAIKINNIRQHEAAVVRFMDSWRQVAQIIFLTLPPEVLTLEEQQILLIELLEALLMKMLNCDTTPEVATLASGAVLILTNSLLKSHIKSLKRKEVISPDDTERHYVQNVIYSNTSSLKYILHSILEWIIISGVPTQRLRVNLYSALLSFLNLISAGYETSRLSNHNSFYVSRLDDHSESLDDDRILISADALSGFGDKLIEVLCHDCISGHDICRMLAMSSFNMLILLNLQPNWIQYLSSKGYLKHLIDSLLNSDTDLKAILETLPDTLRPVYLYETKMCFLTRLATTQIGAEILMEQRIIPCLSSMKVFDDHPKIEKSPEDDAIEDFLPPVESRYQQIFYPALQLCDAILISLGTDNKTAVSHIIDFLLSHIEVIELILQQGRPTLPASFLKELALLTGLIARTANNEMFFAMHTSPTSLQSDQAYLQRIKKLMLALLPRFVLSDGIIKDLTSVSAKHKEEDARPERLIYSLQVCSNLLLYVRNLSSNHGIEHGSASVIFRPTLSDPLAPVKGNRSQFSHYSEHTPNIGVIIQQLIYCVQYYHNEKVTLDLLTRKVSTIPTMNSIDLKEFITIPSRTYNIHMIREAALQKLTERLNIKQREIEYTTFIIENCVYLIWSHLDFYLLKAIPKTKTYGFGSTNDSCNDGPVLPSEIYWKVATEEISKLKQGLVSIFNDIFSRKLLETTRDRPELDKGFTEALLRRIKRLIQFVPVK